jgi:hypothetical protein
MRTAVEFLLEKYKSQNTLLFAEDFEQAKKMEKEDKIEFACQVAEASAMKYVQGKTTRMIAEELLTFK